jgi:hypothetical protein
LVYDQHLLDNVVLVYLGKLAHAVYVPEDVKV